jgi:valyl-tRNA synthetase
MKPLAEPAIEALKKDKIKFYPSSKKDQLITYLEGLKDWNISRQIAWGIPIPAFQNVDDPDNWVYSEDVDKKEIKVGSKTYRRDPDVFDTWFSSSSWPYATLDYPDGEDFKKFYPLNLMETGADILYPWVSRMIIFGLYTTGQVPFKEVYLHGLIQDEHGAKMSKSKGNVINPIEKVKEYGSDAFRMGIIATETAGNNRPYDTSKVVGARNFANKLWNIARYVEDKIGNDFAAKNTPQPQTAADYWLLSKLQQLTDSISADLDKYRFAEAYEKLYHLVWDDFADWYIEASKISANDGILAHGLETILKLAHPFAPFVTETIWQTLAWEKDIMLATSHWPQIEGADKVKAAEFEEIKNIVSEARYFIKELGLKLPVLRYAGIPLISENQELIKTLAGLASLEKTEKGGGLQLAQTSTRVWLDVDTKTIEKHLKQLEKRAGEQSMLVKRLEDRLANKQYIANAPKKVVAETKQQLEQEKEILGKLQSETKRFS